MNDFHRGRRPANIFVSYAHADTARLLELHQSLRGLQRDGLIGEIWDDREIPAGEKWPSVIDNRLFMADVIVLLLTSAFVASDVAYEKELAVATRRKLEGTTVFPIWVDHYDSPAGASFKESQRVPSDRPIADKGAKGWEEVAGELRKRLERRYPRPAIYELDTAPDARNMAGRDDNLSQLKTWIDDSQCRVIVLEGSKGIGKSTLAARLIRDVVDRDVRIWRRVHDGPPLPRLIQSLLPVLRPLLPPEGDTLTDERLLTRALTAWRCLLVVDNFESLIEGDEGRPREGYQDYAPWLRGLADEAHNSCVIITTRAPIPWLHDPKLARHVRRMRVDLMSGAAARSIFIVVDSVFESVAVSDPTWNEVAERGFGNPLGFNILARAVVNRGGDLRAFLASVPPYADIDHLIDATLDGLSHDERRIVHWIAAAREPTGLNQIRTWLLSEADRRALDGHFESLAKVLPIESAGRLRFLQPVLLERATTRFVVDAAKEILAGDPQLLRSVALCLTQSPEYVQDAQRRWRIAAIVDQLKWSSKATDSEAATRHTLLALLERCHKGQTDKTTYLPGNLLNLLGVFPNGLRGVNAAGLTIRQGLFRQSSLAGADFRDARFVDTAFTEVFGSARAVRASHDGHIVTAGVDGVVRQWRMPEMRLERVFDRIAGTLLDLALGPQSPLIAVASNTGVVTLLDGNHRRELKGGWGWAMSVDVDPAGETIAVGYRDEVAVLWDVRSGARLMAPFEHANLRNVKRQRRVAGVVFSPDGKTLATACEDGLVRIWDVADGSLRCHHDGHASGKGDEGLEADRVFAVRFRRDGYVVSGGADGTVQIWLPSAHDSHPPFVAHRHQGRVRCVAVSEDGNRIASGGEDHTVRLWNPESDHAAIAIEHGNLVRSVAMVPRLRAVASVSDDRTIRIWDSLSGRPLWFALGYATGQKCVASLPGYPCLVTGGNDGTLRVWNYMKSHCIAEVKAHAGGLWAIATDARGQRIATGGDDKKIRLWDVSPGPDGDPLIKEDTSITTSLMHRLRVFSVAFSPDRRFLASGSEDQCVRVWRMPDLAPYGPFHRHANGVTAIAFDASTSHLVSGSDDRTVAVWDCATWRARDWPGSPAERINAVAAGHTAGNDWMASADSAGTISLWRSRDRESAHIRRFNCATPILGLAFSRDDDWLAAAGADGAVYIFATAGEESSARHRLQVSSFPLTGLCYLDGGDFLAIVGEENDAVKMWDLKARKLRDAMTPERLYDGMLIHGTDLSGIQRSVLKHLGARD